MCRHAAFLGTSRPIGALFAAPHGLEHQAYAPKELLSGTVCADGFGAAWLAEGHGLARYASPLPVWSDANLQSIGPAIRSTCAMGAVRTATVPGANIEANCAPFVADGWMWSHNGYLDKFEAWDAWWQGRIRRRPRGSTDSEVLFLMFLEALRTAPDPAAALTSVLAAAREEALERRVQAQLNVMASDGSRIVATRWSAKGPSNSLYTSTTDGVRIASEPLDGGTWEQVPDGSLVLAGPDGLQIAPL